MIYCNCEKCKLAREVASRPISWFPSVPYGGRSVMIEAGYNRLRAENKELKSRLAASTPYRRIEMSVTYDTNEDFRKAVNIADRLRASLGSTEQETAAYHELLDHVKDMAQRMNRLVAAYPDFLTAFVEEHKHSEEEKPDA